jgi:hypothetical protein
MTRAFLISLNNPSRHVRVVYDYNKQDDERAEAAE